MQIDMVGPGRMGGGAVRRLLDAGHLAVAYDLDAAHEAAAAAGAEEDM